MEQGIIENNKLIGEFMYPSAKKDFDAIPDSGDVDESYFQIAKMMMIVGDYNLLKYHSSWDWLMPVIERMKFIDDHQDDFFEDYYSINFKMEFFYGVELWINKERLFLQTAFGEDQLIEATYSAVIEFIKWYNKNKNGKK